MAAAGSGGPQGPGGAPSAKRFTLNVSLYFQSVFGELLVDLYVFHTELGSWQSFVAEF